MRKLILMFSVLLMLFSFNATANAAPIVSVKANFAGADGVLDVMPIGDSLTRGQGDPNWWGFRGDVRARLIRQGVSVNFVGPWIDGTGADHEHAGTSGARIDQVNVQIPQLMTVYKPDVVLILLGTNDTGQQYELTTVSDRMTSLVNRVLQFRPSARVFVSTIPGWANQTAQANADIVNNGIRAAVNGLGNPNVSLVPNDIVRDPAKDLTSDGVHLNQCGYAKLAFVWFLYMNNSNLNPTPGSWLGGYWPWDGTGVCS